MWRNLYESEKEELLLIYETQKKAIAWFFKIWKYIGVFGIIGMIYNTITSVISGDFFMIFFGVASILMLYFFFVKLGDWILGEGLNREIDSIKSDIARAYDTELLNVRMTTTYNNNKTKHKYYALVKTEIDGEIIEIEVNTIEHVYKYLDIGSPVLLVSFKPYEKTYMTVLPVLDNRDSHNI